MNLKIEKELLENVDEAFANTREKEVLKKKVGYPLNPQISLFINIPTHAIVGDDVSKS